MTQRRYPHWRRAFDAKLESSIFLFFLHSSPVSASPTCTPFVSVHTSYPIPSLPFCFLHFPPYSAQYRMHSSSSCGAFTQCTSSASVKICPSRHHISPPHIRLLTRSHTVAYMYVSPSRHAEVLVGATEVGKSTYHFSTQQDPSHHLILASATGIDLIQSLCESTEKFCAVEIYRSVALLRRFLFTDSPSKHAEDYASTLTKPIFKWGAPAAQHSTEGPRMSGNFCQRIDVQM